MVNKRRGCGFGRDYRDRWWWIYLVKTWQTSAQLTISIDRLTFRPQWRLCKSQETVFVVAIQTLRCQERCPNINVLNSVDSRLPQPMFKFHLKFRWATDTLRWDEHVVASFSIQLQSNRKFTLELSRLYAIYSMLLTSFGAPQFTRYSNWKTCCGISLWTYNRSWIWSDWNRYLKLYKSQNLV